MNRYPNSRSAVFVTMMLILALVMLNPVAAMAHVSEQGFVLLLPTGTYIISGVAAVALSVLIIGVLPPGFATGLFSELQLFRCRLPSLETWTSLTATLVLAAILVIGIIGPHDPLRNALPLFIWTVWWVLFFIIQGLVGDIWRWVNPGTGVYQLLRGNLEKPGLLVLPKWIGCWPGIVGYLSFAGQSPN